MTDSKQYIHPKIQEFRLLWGIAPKGSLKYNKGLEIEQFLADVIAQVESDAKQRFNDELKAHVKLCYLLDEGNCHAAWFIEKKEHTT